MNATGTTEAADTKDAPGKQGGAATAQARVPHGAPPDTPWGGQAGQHDVWPSAAQELLLRAALMPDERALSAWRQVRAQIDVEALDGATQALLPALRKNLLALGEEDELLNLFKGVQRYSWARTQSAARADDANRAGARGRRHSHAAAEGRGVRGRHTAGRGHAPDERHRRARAHGAGARRDRRAARERARAGRRGPGLVRRRVRVAVRAQSRLSRSPRPSAGSALARAARLLPARRGRGLLGGGRADRAARRTHARAVPGGRAAAGDPARAALERDPHLPVGGGRRAAVLGGDRPGRLRATGGAGTQAPRERDAAGGALLPAAGGRRPGPPADDACARLAAPAPARACGSSVHRAPSRAGAARCSGR